MLSRRRIQRFCYETRMHTRLGRLPLILRIQPTEVGERVLNGDPITTGTSGPLWLSLGGSAASRHARARSA